MTAIAVLGLGAMGSRIAQRLVDAGHDVVVWNRDPAKTAGVAGRVASPLDAVRTADVAIRMVRDEPALEAATQFPADAAVAIVQMSTVGRGATERLMHRLPAGIELLDEPVLGSIAEAEAGTLRIFAGGPAKLVANFALLSTLAALGESLALAEDAGLTRDKAFDVLAATPLGAQAERRRAAVESREYPPRFKLELAEKDARLARDASERPLAAATQTWFERALAAGRGADDCTAVLAEILGR
jgi:3-hydroxyisobutyrate dehydrogenase-like beta-hydroxyacid dehydrogenase